MKLPLYFTFLLLLTSPTIISSDITVNSMVIWNVGQGLWTTMINSDSCFHFDTGGDHIPIKRIESLCKGKINQISISHWDNDHFNGLSKWPQTLTACIAYAPLGKTTQHKKIILSHFQRCPSNALIFKKTNHWSPTTPQLNTNERSHIIKFNRFLIPGDSPQKMEKEWSPLNWVSSSEVLLLGHHGSKTSTSKELLTRLPRLKMAIASARWKKYHHPHPETQYILKKFKIPLLRTEDWGNIWFDGIK